MPKLKGGWKRRGEEGKRKGRKSKREDKKGKLGKITKKINEIKKALPIHFVKIIPPTQFWFIYFHFY